MVVMPKDGVSRDDKLLFYLTNEIAYTRDRHVRNWSATTREIVVVEGAACRLGSCRLNCETVQLVEKTSRGLEIPISRTRFLVIVTTFSHSERLGVGHRLDHIRFDAWRTHTNNSQPFVSKQLSRKNDVCQSRQKRLQQSQHCASSCVVSFSRY